MKFGKAIQTQQRAEWADHYVNYKGLKKQIKISLGKVSAAPLTPPIFSTPADSPQFFAQPHGIENAETKVLQNQKTAFFFKLERELEKVNRFYLHKEAELRVRLRTLVDKKKILLSRKTKGSSENSLKQAFVQFQEDLNKLQKFVEINGTGFRKILKKWDKRSKSSTKELYLSRQVEVQPCFNKEIIAELSDTAAAHLSGLNNARETLAGSDAHLPNPAASEVSLINNGLRQNSAVSDDEENELFRAVHLNEDSTVRHILERQSSKDVAEKREVISRVFWRACSETWTPSLQLLISTQLIDYDHVDEVSDRSCIHEAAITGNLPMLKIIVDNRGTLEAVDVYGRRSLHYLAMHGHSDCATYLLEKQAEVAPMDHDGLTPLIYSTMGGHTKCVELFLDHGASLNATASRDGGTGPVPLSLACQYGHTDIATILLNRGADMSANADGLGPLHFAARGGHSDMTRLLASYGAPVDASDTYNGWTPIFYAVSEGHVECARVLLAAGAQAFFADDAGATPMYYAASEGHFECVQLLAEAKRPQSKKNQKSESQLLQHRAISQLPPSESLLNNETSVDATLEMDPDFDAIPSLLLPPPILPFRIYGHNYLDKMYQIQINLGHIFSRNHARQPVLLYGARQISSLKLLMTSRPDTGMIPHNIILPLSDELETFSFLVDGSNQFSLEFDVYPTFGTRVMGRAVALPSMFDLSSESGISIGKAVCPLIDDHLKVIGEIAFEYHVIKPFRGVELEIGGRVDTYWKATVAQLPKPPPAVHSVASSNNQSSSADHPSTILSSANVNGSLITSSSLSKEYLQLSVQMTKDGIPAVYSGWKLPVSEFDVSVKNVTYMQFKQFGKNCQHENLEPPRSSADWRARIYDTYMGLDEVLNMLPIHLGVNVEIWYPTPSEMIAYRLSDTADINLYVDTILQTVYEYAHKTASRKKFSIVDGQHTPPSSKSSQDNHVDMEIDSNADDQRSFIFSSMNPSVCTALNWKQPNYAVFFKTFAGFSPTCAKSSKRKLKNQHGVTEMQRDTSTTLPTEKRMLPLMEVTSHDTTRPENDRRCSSIKEAVGFAKANNLLGVICEATPLIQVPELINTIKESGLILGTFGVANDEMKNVHLQESYGVDAMVVGGVLKYGGGVGSEPTGF